MNGLPTTESLLGLTDSAVGKPLNLLRCKNYDFWSLAWSMYSMSKDSIPILGKIFDPWLNKSFPVDDYLSQDGLLCRNLIKNE